MRFKFAGTLPQHLDANEYTGQYIDADRGGRYLALSYKIRKHHVNLVMIPESALESQANWVGGLPPGTLSNTPQTEKHLGVIAKLLQDVCQYKQACDTIVAAWRMHRQVKAIQSAMEINIYEHAKKNRRQFFPRLHNVLNSVGVNERGDYIALLEYLLSKDIYLHHGSAHFDEIKESGYLLSSRCLKALSTDMEERICTPTNLGYDHTVFFSQSISDKAPFNVIPGLDFSSYLFNLNLSQMLRHSSIAKYRYWSSSAFYSYGIAKYMPPFMLGDTLVLNSFGAGSQIKEGFQHFRYYRNKELIKEEKFRIGDEVYWSYDIQRMNALRVLEQLSFTGVDFQRHILDAVSTGDEFVVTNLYQTLFHSWAREVHANAYVKTSQMQVFKFNQAPSLKLYTDIINAIKDSKPLPDNLSGINLNIYRSRDMACDAFGTPLFLAIDRSNYTAVEELLDSGADPNYCPFPNAPSALYLAVLKGDHKITSLLLQHPLKSHRGEQSITLLVDPWRSGFLDPLFLAVFGRVDAVSLQLLLEHHALYDEKLLDALFEKIGWFNNPDNFCDVSIVEVRKVVLLLVKVLLKHPFKQKSYPQLVKLVQTLFEDNEMYRFGFESPDHLNPVALLSYLCVRKEDRLFRLIYFRYLFADNTLACLLIIAQFPTMVHNILFSSFMPMEDVVRTGLIEERLQSFDDYESSGVRVECKAEADDRRGDKPEGQRYYFSPLDVCSFFNNQIIASAIRSQEKDCATLRPSDVCTKP